MLSLDAPLIAAVWQDAFAYDAGVRLTVASRAALPLAVWLIYLCDRLLDTRKGYTSELSARHAFYCTHRPLSYFMTTLAAVFVSISIVYLPLPVMENGLAVAWVVAIYLAAVHCLGAEWRRRVPKEAAVGLVFAVGTVLAPLTHAAKLWYLIFPALLFGVLCWLNCSAIEVWERGQADCISRLLVKHVNAVAVVTALLCLPLSLWGPAHHVTLALCIASMGLACLAEEKDGLNADALRVLVDVPLLAPLLLLGLR